MARDAIAPLAHHPSSSITYAAKGEGDVTAYVFSSEYPSDDLGTSSGALEDHLSPSSSND